MADDSPFMTDAALFGAPPAPYPKGVERVETVRVAPTAEVTAGTATFEFNVPAGEGLLDLLNTSVELNLAVEDTDPANPGHNMSSGWGKEVSLDPMLPDALFSRCEVTLNGRAMDDAADADMAYCAAARRMLLGEPGDLDFEAASFLGAPAGVPPGAGLAAPGHVETPAGFEPTAYVTHTAIADVPALVAWFEAHVFGASTDTLADWTLSTGLKEFCVNAFAYRLLQNKSAAAAAEWLNHTGIANRFDADTVGTQPGSLNNGPVEDWWNELVVAGYTDIVTLIADNKNWPSVVPNGLLFPTATHPHGTIPTLANPVTHRDDFAVAIEALATVFNNLFLTYVSSRGAADATLPVIVGGVGLVGRGATTLCGIPNTGMLPAALATAAGEAPGDIPLTILGGAGGINHSAPGASANQVARNASAWYHGTGAGASKIPLVVNYRPSHVLFSGGRHSRYLPAGTNLKIRFTLSRQTARLFRKRATDPVEPRIGFVASSVAAGFQPMLLVTRVYPTNSMRAALALSLEKAGHRLLLTRCRAQSFDLATSAASSASTTRTGLVSGSKPARIVIFAVPAAAYDGDPALSWLGCGRAARLAYYDDTAAGYAQHAPVGTVTHCRVIWGGTPCPWVLDQTSQKDEAMPEAYAEYRRACEGSGPVLSYGQYLNCMPLVFTPAQNYPAGGPGGYQHEASDVSSHSSAQVEIEVGPIGDGTAPPAGRSSAYKIVVVALESCEVTCDASKTYSRSW